MSSSFVYPHIMLSSFVTDENRHSVWELSPNAIEKKIDVPNIDYFFRDGKTALLPTVTHMKYIHNYFMMKWCPRQRSVCEFIPLPHSLGLNRV